MVGFAGFGLPIQKGDGLAFDQVLAAPPVVRLELRASKQWFEGRDQKTRQQAAEDIADRYLGVVQQFVQGQRQNYNLSNVTLWRKLYSVPGLDIEYTMRAGFETIVLTAYPENTPPVTGGRTITIVIPSLIAVRVGYEGTETDDGKMQYGSFVTDSDLRGAGHDADISKGQFYTGLPLKYKGSAEKTSRYYFEFHCTKLSRPTGVPDKVEPLGGTDDGTFSDSPTFHNNLVENRTKYPDSLNTHRTPVFGLSSLADDVVGKPDFFPNSTTIGLNVYDEDGIYTGDIPEGPRDPYLMPQSSLLGDITIRGKVHYDFALVASDGSVFFIPQDGSAYTSWTVGIRYRFDTEVWVYRGFNNNLSPATSPPPGDGWEDLGGSGGYPPPDYIYEPIVVDPDGDLTVYVDGPGGVFERDTGTGAVNVYENLAASPPYWYVKRIRDYYNRLYTHDAYTTSYQDLLLDYATLGTVEDNGVWTSDVTTYPETVYHNQWFGDLSNAPDWSGGTSSFQAVHAGRWSEVYKGCWDNLLTSEPSHDGAPIDDDGFKTDGVWSGVEMPDLKDGDIVMCAVDMDVPAVWFGRNGVWPTLPVMGGEGNISLSDYGGDPRDLLLTPVVAFYSTPGWTFKDFPLAVDVVVSGTKHDPPPGFALFGETLEITVDLP